MTANYLVCNIEDTYKVGALEIWGITRPYYEGI